MVDAIRDPDDREAFDTIVALLRQRAEGSVDDLLEAIGALEVAQEELRVADEELAAQREQIDTLLEQHEAELLWRQRLVTALPLPLLRTRTDGLVTEANAASAVLLGIGLTELVGKPLLARVGQDDRTRLRQALRDVSTTGQEQHLTFLVLPRGSPSATRVTAVVTRVDGTHGLGVVQWVLLTQAHEPAPESRIPSAQDIETARALAAMCQLPLLSQDRQHLLGELAVLAQQAVPRAHAVSVTLGSPQDPNQLSSDKLVAQQLDAAQMETGEGPCVDGFETRTTVMTRDVRTDRRWPRLGGRVAHLGIGGVVAVPLMATDDCLGVLNVYALEAAALDEADVRVSELAARGVAAVLRTVSERNALSELADNLDRALSSRAVIDQAKGIVMGRYGCSADEAFQRLSALSQRRNVKLREIARLLVEGVERGEAAAELSPPAGP